MTGERIAAITDADAARRLLEARINEFNVEATGIDDGAAIGWLVRDDRDEIFAGLSGWTWGGCLFVEFLWVRDDRRGQGWGSHLLATAEDHARNHGCERVALATHSFQAPAFYRARGYHEVGTIDGYPRGHRQHILVKSLV